MLTASPGVGNGEFIVVMDDPGRENEGDLIIAAEDITTEQMAMTTRESSALGHATAGYQRGCITVGHLAVPAY